MINLTFKGPSKSDLMKMLTAAAEKKISEKAQKAAAHLGGVRVSFRKNSDGSLCSVEFQGADSAVQAAQAAFASK